MVPCTAGKPHVHQVIPSSCVLTHPLLASMQGDPEGWRSLTDGYITLQVVHDQSSLEAPYRIVSAGKTREVGVGTMPNSGYYSRDWLHVWLLESALADTQSPPPYSST